MRTATFITDYKCGSNDHRRHLYPLSRFPAKVKCRPVRVLLRNLMNVIQLFNGCFWIGIQKLSE